MATICQVQISEDIEKILKDKSIDETVKARLVNTRVGQGQFREELIRYWRGCAITGYEMKQFLVASHIKPWSKSSNEERLDVFNGILLLPNLDKAFDLGYISFEENGQIKTSDFIESPSVLGIRDDMRIDFIPPHQEYLAYHRDVVFKK